MEKERNRKIEGERQVLYTDRERQQTERDRVLYILKYAFSTFLELKSFQKVRNSKKFESKFSKKNC